MPSTNLANQQGSAATMQALAAAGMAPGGRVVTLENHVRRETLDLPAFRPAVGCGNAAHIRSR